MNWTPRCRPAPPGSPRRSGGAYSTSGCARSPGCSGYSRRVMAGTLDGKRAIVTGGGQGVGRGIALALAAEGAAVALVGRTETKLLAVAAEISKPGGTALPVVADVTRPADIERCVAHTVSALGGIDILVNNAQVPALGSILDVTDEAFSACWESGPLAAAEWGPDGIRVIAVLPAATSPASRAWRQANPAEYERSMSSIPLRRLGDAEEEIGPVVAFLCGPAESYITGTTIAVDGGQAYLR